MGRLDLPDPDTDEGWRYERRERSIMDDSKTQTQAAQLDELRAAASKANVRVLRLTRDLADAKKEAELATKRYRRQALWLRASELRKQAAQAEADAAAIKL